MDGDANFGAFGCQAGPDCLKDILPKYSQRIKVYHAIEQLHIHGNEKLCNLALTHCHVVVQPSIILNTCFVDPILLLYCLDSEYCCDYMKTY